MDYPKIRRFDIGDVKHVRLEMASFHSRPVTEGELRQLRDELNADAAEETVARVTTDELRSLAVDLTYARDADEKSPPELLAVLTRVSNELAEMSKRAAPVALSNLTGEFGDPTPEFVAAIRKAADEIESGPQYAGTVLHALVADLFELGYEPGRGGNGGTATLWQVDHVDGDWLYDRDSLDVIRRREVSDPPTWTAEPLTAGHQWWYSAWNRQRRLLTFDADIEAWFLLDDGHVNETPSPLNGWTHSDVCAFAGEGDMFAPATIPNCPEVTP